MVHFDPRSTGALDAEPRGEGSVAAQTIPIRVLREAAQRAHRMRRLDEPAASRVEEAVQRARGHLFLTQRPDGHWVDELEGNSILESEYMLLLRYLGRWGEPRVRELGEHVRRIQRPQGGWSIYPGGPADVSASVKAYYVLKLLGDSTEAPHLARAREVIRDLGGLEATNSFTKIQLALFGQYPWAKCPAIPPELVLFPSWSQVGLYELSSWSRVMVVPLSIVWAHQPVREESRELGLGELHVERAPRRSEGPLEERFWRRFFLGVDALLKLGERGKKPLRGAALRAAERWMLERMDHSDGLGAIFPPMVQSVLAMKCLGYADDHPRVRAQLEELERLELREDGAARVQPCVGPVWDTALALHALVESRRGTGEDPRALAAARWLLSKEVRRRGDWSVKAPGTEPGGWAFEYENPYYPDCDDTAQVLTAMARVRFPEPAEQVRARGTIQRAVRWLLAMQGADGGWAAFDKDCDRRLFTFVPFADHNAMIDPSSEDITGRVLEALILSGVDRAHPAVRRGVRFLQKRQEADGTWYGRWGSNYLYGTHLALRGLRAAGEDLTAPRYQKAGAWIRQMQNADGGWGESFESYDNPAFKGRGESTATQTAWALLGLFELSDFDSEAVRGGVAHLLKTQDERGAWSDGPWTGTGFPRVFYLRYALYDDHFPLLALGAYLARRKEEEGR